MRQERNYYVYINTNKLHHVFYTGVTNNLLQRNNQHKTKNNKISFASKYNVNKLVWYETFNNTMLLPEKSKSKAVRERRK